MYRIIGCRDFKDHQHNASGHRWGRLRQTHIRATMLNCFIRLRKHVVFSNILECFIISVWLTIVAGCFMNLSIAGCELKLERGSALITGTNTDQPVLQHHSMVSSHTVGSDPPQGSLYNKVTEPTKWKPLLLEKGRLI